MPIIIFTLIVIINSLATAQNYGSWHEIDSMNIARVAHAMVVLPNGDVLVSGGEGENFQSSAEIYEFSTGKWRYTSSMNVPRSSHNLVLLNTGKVLAIGGYKEQSCELFDPQTETWTITDSIPTFRFDGQTVTELTDGRVMVAGGYYFDTTKREFIILNNVDIYNPITETWSEASPMNIVRNGHTATLLPDGRVLVAGGGTENYSATNQCEIYNPTTNSWELTGNLQTKRSDHAAMLLSPERVLVCGGYATALVESKSCEVYDIQLGTWSYASDMLANRTYPKIYFLRKHNKLLILGGDGSSSSPQDTWEIYDPNSLQPEFLEPFPINQFLFDNNVQLLNGNIFLAGNQEYMFTPMPVLWPSKRCWLFDVTTDVNEEKETLQEYKLDQNFPNPFNAQTTINYTLPFNAYVRMIVYDILGNEVEILVDEIQPAGSYNINYKAENLSSGIYYYRLTVMETEKRNGITYQQTKKMILLR